MFNLIAPVVTSEITTKLEDIIKQRIKDKAFDDVERKIKPVEMNYEFKKQTMLDQEKSKISLSQVYEQDYLNKAAEVGKTAETGDVVEKVNPKHEEIRKGLESLFIKLDALSNFHYTPKAVLRNILLSYFKYKIYN
jgi:U3 small nucleolar RNA-associated protein MPP10